MFVDKKLSGLKAVQTLSRLNRIHQDKEDTFILDFVNRAEDIQEAFKPYYETTIIEEVTDPNVLYDLERELTSHGVFHQEEVERFNAIFYKTTRASDDKAKLNHLIDTARERFRFLKQDSQEDSKGKAKKFQRLYTFIIQITPFVDVNLHKLYIYLSFLLKKLPKEPRDILDLSDEVALDYYVNKLIFEGSLSLDPGVEYKPLAPASGVGTPKEEKKEKLSTIIERLNERFGTDFTDAEKLSIEQIKADFANDRDLVLKAKTNDIDDFRYAYNKAFMEKVVDRIGHNEKFFARILDDEEFRTALMDEMLGETYHKLREEAV